MRTNRKLKAQYPGEPWKWDPAWLSGVIRTNSLQETVILTIVAVVWNGISWAIVAAILPKAMRDGNQPALLVLLFPFFGLLLLWATVAQWRKHARFGKAVFTVSPCPGVIGGKLEGMLEIPGFMAFSTPPLDISLYCERVHVSGGEHISRNVLWQANYRAPSGRTGRGLQLPVSFSVPYACEESTAANGYPRIEWHLAVQGSLDGRKLALRFHVPVFKTELSNPKVTEEDVIAEQLQRNAVDLKSAGFMVQSNANGDLRIQVKPMATKSKSTVVGFVAVMLLLSAGLVLMVKFGAPVGLIVIFSLIDLVLVGAVVSLLTFCTTTVITDREIQAELRFGPYRRRRIFAVDEVAEVKTFQSMTTQTSGQTPVVYYGLRLVLIDGRNPILIFNSKEREELEYLVHMIRHKIGLPETAAQTSPQASPWGAV